ncbi:hypothetical protein J2X65_005350 [Ancylobacter sp. 3268]|uniref:hypothetical protein n=1 Tax=Ancylobacter sp. 3268 TaxID=2817752 RepID=UPI0028563559|nr:hypothetical protein [Ancylobacter sp. 3268]MDR6955963.1 hypothetical protein [Ancylobacter sp. 3268]
MPEITETDRANDLDNFTPSISEYRIDDKAAALEADLVERKAQYNKERFCYHFIIVALFNMLMLGGQSSAVATLSLIASLILLIGIGKWLDFPFIHDRLDKWERLFFRAFEKKTTNKIDIDTEPMV